MKTKTPSKQELHKTYGGEIYLSDFEAGYVKSLAYIANRVKRAEAFDEMCVRNDSIREGRQLS